MKAKKIVTLGEIMLRLSPNGFYRFGQTDQLHAVFGGGEANVAVSLANYGNDAYFVTKVPEHEIGEAAVMSLKKYGVNTEHIVRGGERLGIYYLEVGASIRPSKVIYDRKNSAISQAAPEEFDFEAIFKDCDWFHFTGITPALSRNAYHITLEALKSAKKYNVTVSCDLNYRRKLWTPAEAQECMTTLIPYVDVLIGNEEDIEKCLGYKIKYTDVAKGALNIDGYKEIFKVLHEKYRFKYIATSLRESYSASFNGWSAVIYDGKNFYQSKRYEINLVDRIGGGDSFAGGLIHSFVNGKDYKYAAEFAVAASALKQTIHGDFNLASLAEVENLMRGDTSGRVQR